MTTALTLTLLLAFATTIYSFDDRTCVDTIPDVCAALGGVCEPVVGSICPDTCGLCNLACADNDDIVAVLNPLNTTNGGTCASNKGNCDNDVHGAFFKLYCPITCELCSVPEPEPFTCGDHPDELRQLTQQQNLNCEYVSSQGLCSGSSVFFPSYCPITCGLCPGRACVDDDSSVADLQIPGVTTCAQVSSGSHCDVAIFDLIFGLYCPVSCGVCTAGSSVPDATPTASPAPASASRAPSTTPAVSPSQGATPSPNSNQTTDDSSDSKSGNDTGIVVAAVLIAGAAVALVAFLILRRRGSNNRGRVYPRSDEPEDMEMQHARKIIE